MVWETSRKYSIILGAVILYDERSKPWPRSDFASEHYGCFIRFLHSVSLWKAAAERPESSIALELKENLHTWVRSCGVLLSYQYQPRKMAAMQLVSPGRGPAP